MRNEGSNRQDRPGQKILLGILTMAACAVWASVYFRATGGWQHPEAPDRAADSLQVEKAPSHAAALLYQGAARDIFRPPAAGAATPVSEAPNEASRHAASLRLPSLRRVLIGVVDGTALLRDPDGHVALAREGDTLSRRRIHAIQPGLVILFSNAGPPDTLHLHDPPGWQDWFN